MIDNPAFRYYALASTVLALQLVLLAGWTGTVRVRRKRYVNPEDAAASKGEHAESEHEDVLRVKRAHANAIENAVPFFVIGALYAATVATTSGAQIYFATFVGARLLHSVFYLWGRQPFRTLAFTIGVLATIGMAAGVLRAVL